MKKRLNIYCIMLITAIAVGTVIASCQGIMICINTFTQAFEAGMQDAQSGTERVQIEKIRPKYALEMFPKNFLTQNDSIYDSRSQRYVTIIPCQAVICDEQVDSPLTSNGGIIGALGYGMVGCFFVFIILFIKMIININKGRIFDGTVENHLKILGITIFIDFILEVMSTTLMYISVVSTYDFRDYIALFPSDNKMYLLYFAIGAFVIREIFKIAREMKEEQELTI